MIPDTKQKRFGSQFDDAIKEKSIRTNFYSEEKRVQKKIPQTYNKEFLFFDPPEIIIQNIEIKKIYEIPVRIHNISTTSKRILIKQPTTSFFKIISDKKQKNFQISPGLYYEFLVVFEPDDNTNYSDLIEVNSENNLKIFLKMNAYKCRALVVFDPFINLGFVPVNSKKVEKISFVNEGSEGCNIELRLMDKNAVDLELLKDKFTLSRIIKEKNNPNYGKHLFESFLLYNPEMASTLNQKIEVFNLNENEVLGYIDVIGTSVEQQLSVVFEDGGGPSTEVNFGQIFYGQKKECPAFLVNNGPYEIGFRMFFHIDKDRNDTNLKLDDSDFACTPEQAGIEMTQRILGCNVKQGTVKPYQQLPILFQAKSKLQDSFKKWGGHICEEYEKFQNKEGSVAKLDENKNEIHKSILAIKFDQKFEKQENIENQVFSDEKICKTISVYMELKTVYPDVLFDKTIINFWECKIGESKSVKLRITNKNESLPIDFSFGKIPYFYVDPALGTINPNSDLTFIITFIPKNYGKFTNTIPFKYINNLYEVGIKVLAKATLEADPEKKLMINRDMLLTTMGSKGFKSTSEKKEHRLLGPEATDINFMRKPNFISDELAMNYTLPSLKKTTLLSDRTNQIFKQRMLQIEHNKSNKVIIDNFRKKFDEYKKEQEHRNQANNTLVEFRKKREKHVLSKNSDIVLSTDPGLSTLTTRFNSTTKIGLDSLTGRLESPRFEIPKTNEGLWVNRPIGKYEPSELIEQLLIKPEFNSLLKPTSIPESYPKSASDKRECEMALDGYKLQRIFVGARELNFGEVYKGSEEARTLWIKNTLRTSIYFEIISSEFPELKSIHPSSFVIGPGCTEGCVITFSSHLIKKHNFYIKYKINYKQQFKVKILADVVLANLKFSPLQKFAFQQMNSMDMIVSQKLPLYNGGNADAYFNFENGKTGHFRVTPSKGTVKPKEEFEVSVEFDPLEIDHKKDVYDDLKCFIENGEKISLQVVGQIIPSKAEFVVSDTVNFQDISVSVYEKSFFAIKCEKGGPTAFQITEYPSNISFSETKGIIDNKVKQIEIKIICDKIGLFKSQIKIKIRGGGPGLFLNILANPIEPTVIVSTNLIDFGEQSFGEQEKRPLILTNKSNLSGYVVVDIRSPEFDFFKLRLSDKYSSSKDYLIKDLEKGEDDTYIQEQMSLEENADDDINADKNSVEGDSGENKLDEEMNQIVEETKVPNYRYFQVEVKKWENLEFDFIFSPGNDTLQKNYQLTLSMNMKGSTAINPALQVDIIAKQKDSLITLNPREKLLFRKTFIGKSDKSQSTSYSNLKVYCNHVHDQKFIIDSSQLDKCFVIEELYEERDRAMGKRKCFNEQTNQGMFNEDQLEIIFRCSFTPTEAKKYESKLIFKPFNNELNSYEKGKEIILSGEGALPKINFDKREIILPIVPLGYESKSNLRIRNEGYGEMNLNHKISSDMGAVDLRVNWVSGKKIGILRAELKLEVIYKAKSDKPFSFTCKLVFVDQDGESFFILVHGTSDNSIFSNYNYLYVNNIYNNYNDKESKYQIKALDSDNINLLEKNEEKEEFIDDVQFYDNSKKPLEEIKQNNNVLLNKDNALEKSILTTTYTKSYKSYLNSNCSYLLSFLNNILSTAITSFPESLCNYNNKGESLMNLIENLSGKAPEFKIEKHEEEPIKRIKQLRELFYNIIVFLQEQGAYLNTVLPEYLLDFSSFKKYIKIDEKYTSKVLASNWEKSTKVLYYYKFIHLESWITLIYQITKVFYLSRVNTTTVTKSLRHLNEDYKKLVMPSIKNSHSNIYSTSEILLLKWLKINHEYITNQTLKDNLTNFSSDLSHGSIVLSSITSYLPHIEENSMKVPKRKQMMERDTKTNSIPEKIFNVLKEYGVYSHFSMEDFLNPNDREMLIFIIILFQNLPHFIPNTILFTCVLNETISQNITITNPSSSKKKIDYIVKKFGSNDFIVNKELNDLRISPGEPPFIYKVTYKSRFKNEVKGKLFFLNKNFGMMYQALPLVYDLVSRVTERKSLGNIIYLRSPLYKKTEHKIVIKSPFNYKGDFKIFPPEIKRKSNKIKKRLGGYVPPNRKKDEAVDDFIPPVFLFKSNDPNLSYRLDPESKSYYLYIFNKDPREIPIYFCPVDTDTYQANIVFFNENLGEFQITIEATPESPDTFDTITFDAEVNEPKDLNIEIKHQNKFLKQACDLIINSEPNKDKQAYLRKMLEVKPETKTIYSVDVTKTFFSTHNVFTMDPVYVAEKLYEQAWQYMIIKFHSKSVQTVEGDLIIRSNERSNDVRIYKVIVKVKPKNIYGSLYFNCPVGQEITQKIPFHNNNEKDCIIKAELSQTPNRGYFSCLTEKRIAKKLTENFNLKFSPAEKINVNGVLVLKNNLTGEMYEYKLEGKVDDPLAEDMIHIICPVRKTEVRHIALENNEDREIFYTVETDLSDVITGLTKFSMKPKQKYNYEFTVKPLLGKIYFGKLTFYPDILKTYKWYTIKIESKSQIEPEIIKLKTPIRKSVYVEIILENPTSEFITFDIEYEGEFLKGEQWLTVDPKKSKVYKLLYSPLKIGQSNGILHIYNERVGERIIQLNLICEENKPIYVDTMLSELGKHSDHYLILENPIDEEVTVYISQSNKSQFQIFPEKIIIPENSGREVIVRYTPSQLEHPEDCMILFDTYSIGKWEYYFKGKGTYPSTMAKTTISTYVGGSVSGNVIFKNPFNDKIVVSIELKNDQLATFNLMLPQKKIIVDNYKIIQIPFGFFPKKLMKFTSEIVVTASSLLKWVFPIEGITEVKNKGLDYYFKTKAKKNLETKVLLDLSAVPEQIDIHELNLEIKCKEEKYKNLITKALNMTLDVPFIKTERDIANQVPLSIKFYPLRPFKAECEVCLIKRSGGQWIYTMIFESLEGEPEDIIKIQSSIGKDSTVSFKLHNIFTKNAKFIAYFTHDSSAEFAVKPKEGLLDQSGRNGNIFVIGYLPVEYGKVKIGKLIIETDEIQWIFHVHGSHQEYVLPEVKSNIMAKTQSSMYKTEYSNGLLKTTASRFMKTINNDSKSKSPKWK